MKRFTMFLGLGIALTLFATSWAAAPDSINFQGRLQDGSGNPVTVATDVHFRIYDGSGGGAVLLWGPETHIVTPDAGGLYNVTLGSLVSFPANLFASTPRFLGVTVESDAELSPRTLMASVAYALRVKTVDSASGGNITSKVSIGPGHTNTGINAFVAGEGSTASGDYSTIGGGRDNFVVDIGTTVAGGRNNNARGRYATVGGGGGAVLADSNSALGWYSTVSGGQSNAAVGQSATVGGGHGNTVTGSSATVAGGALNAVSSNSSTIGGGLSNNITVSGIIGTVGGGNSNTVNGFTGTVSGGNSNTANAEAATVGGGNSNTAGGFMSTVAGGRANNASGDYSFVTGQSDTASGFWSAVGGGFLNVADDTATTVAGGRNNKARGRYATVGGGGGSTLADSNSALGEWSTISGGTRSKALGSYGTISGGISNVASGTRAAIGGGQSNSASGDYSTISGGIGNSTGAGVLYGVVGGGFVNAASGGGATVGGGIYDTASGTSSTVPGGSDNKAAGDVSFAAGHRAKALHTGAFVWGDFTAADFSSTGDNQFLIRATGGVGIGTNAPGGKLHVDDADWSSAPVRIKGLSGPVVGPTLEMDATDGTAGNRYSIISTNSGAGALGGKLAIYHNGPTNFGYRLVIDSTGNVGIGTTGPSDGFEVHTSGDTVATFNRNTNDGVIVSLQQAGVTEGTISVAGAIVTYNAFTGSHYGWTEEQLEKGELVSLTGVNRNSHNNPKSEIIYGIKRSAAPNDPACLGSYLALSELSQPYSSENPHLVMAVGNGDMWVVDEGQNIQPGDYLISSSTLGHAMKDDEGKYPIGHIVARAAGGVDWSTVSEMAGGRKHKKISVLFGNFIRSNVASVNRLLERQQQQIELLEKKLEKMQTEKPQAKVK